MFYSFAAMANKILSVFPFINRPSEKQYKILNRKISQDKNVLRAGAGKAVREIALNGKVTHMTPAKACCEIANFMLNCGYPELAQEYFKLSLKFTLDPSTYSLYLQCLLLSPSCTDQMMYPIASNYFNLFLSSIKQYQSHANNLELNRRLHVGYLCHFFHNPVSQSLLLPLLRNHDRARVKVFCYSDAEDSDVSSDVKKVADVWRDTKKYDDVALSEQIRNDEVDILIELNGHCIDNRYGVMAMKPAPVQVCYYNQCSTTGVRTIDYNLIGDEVTLDKSQPYYSESIYFIKGAAGIAEFPNHFPDCAPPPFLKNKFITFGSFGAAHKVNHEVIKVWCAILKKIPSSQFYMKAGVLTFENYVNVYKKIFSDNGIELERITFEGFSEYHEMLGYYSKMDIALDTFPHAAGTTTLEALWQGVPVITLCGEKYCSQNGRSILTSVGHEELIAYTDHDYITKAVELASSPERLIKYRAQLREDFKNSPRADAAGLAKKLDDAFHDMWRKYVESISVSPSAVY